MSDEPFFTEVEAPIRYVGPDSDNPLAFRWYDPDRVVAGRRMEDHLRFAVCYWHSFAWDGFDVFGAGTLDRPWHPTFAGETSPMAAAHRKMAAAFEFFTKLGVPFYCFHDRDIAPEGTSFKESAALLDEMVEVAAGHQERTSASPAPPSSAWAPRLPATRSLVPLPRRSRVMVRRPAAASNRLAELADGLAAADLQPHR